MNIDETDRHGVQLLRAVGVLCLQQADVLEGLIPSDAGALAMAKAMVVTLKREETQICSWLDDWAAVGREYLLTEGRA